MAAESEQHFPSSLPSVARHSSRSRSNSTGDGPMMQIETPYSSFSPAQKTLLAFAASVSAMFSGLSSFVYYPAVTALARSLHVSIESINLTITAYFVVSGLAPSILGDMADHMGRRPISLLALALYFNANLGLALQNNYIALVVLRCLQSAGASSTIALAYGIITDVSTPAERGSYMAILMGLTNAAPSLGPVIGGVLAEKLSWHWIFWLLTIFSGLHLLALLFYLPETSRKLVGDGSMPAARLINRSLFAILVPHQSTSGRPANPPLPFVFPNPLRCLDTLFQKDTIIVLAVGGLQYTIFGCLAASLSTQMIHLYSLNYLTAGLMYLPSGIGGILSAYCSGKLIDHDYRLTARQHGFPTSRSSDTPPGFPFEKARLRSVFPLLAVSAIATGGYGWALEARTSIAVPIVMQFLTGSSQVAIFTVCGSLIADLNPERIATVQAGYNLVRCALSAAGVAALQAITDRVGAGWCFTIYAVIGLLSVPLFMVLRQWGSRWRAHRTAHVEMHGREEVDEKQDGRPKG